MEEIKRHNSQNQKENNEEKQEKEENLKKEEKENIEENYKLEEKEGEKKKEEKKEKGFIGGRLLFGFGSILKNIYDYFTQPTQVYGIGESAIEFKNNHKVDTIIQKMESQNKLKAKVIDNTNDKNYIRANSITELNINETATEYICPITQKIMEEPVITPYGTTYEKSAIIEWIKKNKTDFKTNNLLTEDMLVTNHILNVAIKDYKESIIKNQN